MWLWSVGLAHAGGYSVDVELLRPSFSAGAVPTVDSLQMSRAGTFRVGLLYQYENDPVELYSFERDEGAPVANRSSFHLGASVDLSRRVSLRMILPMSFEWASDVPRLSEQGFGLQDLQAGIRVKALSRGALALGGHLDVFLPTGEQDAWRGEASPRANLGGLLDLNFGRIDVLSDTALMVRGTTETDYDFSLGPELTENAALKLAVWKDRVDLHGGAVARLSLVDVNASSVVIEAVSGLQVHPLPGLDVDLAAGKGLTAGYGTTDIRAMLGATWHRVPPPRPPPPAPVVEKPVEVVPEQVVVPPEPPKPAWQETELARVEQDQIVIRDPIQFEYNTDKILPVSMPTLQYVAKLMTDHPEILQLVIEGHASEEGSFQYNYDLANRRANAIFRALIESGVHPDRLSYRSMGEVKPVTEGTDEVSLAKNRRVIFSITRRLRIGETLPEYTTSIKLPWNGNTVTIPPPGPLPPEYTAPPPKPKPADPDHLDPDQFKEDDDGGGG